MAKESQNRDLLAAALEDCVRIAGETLADPGDEALRQEVHALNEGMRRSAELRDEARAQRDAAQAEVERLRTLIERHCDQLDREALGPRTVDRDNVDNTLYNAALEQPTQPEGGDAHAEPDRESRSERPYVERGGLNDGAAPETSDSGPREGMGGASTATEHAATVETRVPPDGTEEGSRRVGPAWEYQALDGTIIALFHPAREPEDGTVLVPADQPSLIDQAVEEFERRAELPPVRCGTVHLQLQRRWTYEDAASYLRSLQQERRDDG